MYRSVTTQGYLDDAAAVGDVFDWIAGQHYEVWMTNPGRTMLQPFSATARQELLSAAEALLDRNGDGDGVLHKQDLIEEALRRGSRHKQNTLSQMVSVHLCVQPGREGYGQYADFQRVGQGLYRLRRGE